MRSFAECAVCGKTLLMSNAYICSKRWPGECDKNWTKQKTSWNIFAILNGNVFVKGVNKIGENITEDRIYTRNLNNLFLTPYTPPYRVFGNHGIYLLGGYTRCKSVESFRSTENPEESILFRLNSEIKFSNDKTTLLYVVHPKNEESKIVLFDINQKKEIVRFSPQN